MEIIQTPYYLDTKQKHAVKLTSINNTNVIHIQLKANEEISEHHAKEDVLIIVKEGEVIFTVEGQEVLVTKENMLQMEPFEKHSLKAVTDCDLIVIKIPR